MLRRQEACTVSSGGSSDETRRTPERTQSLKLRNRESLSFEKDNKDVNMNSTPVQRSSSFKSDFMKRRFSPEPENRRRLPDTPEQSDKPSPELAKVLNRRNEIVTKQQEDGTDVDRKRIHDGKVEKAERYNVAKDDEVIMDSEVLTMLKSRRKETDSSTEGSAVQSDSEQKSQPNIKTSPAVIEKANDKSVFSKPVETSSTKLSQTPTTQSSKSAITVRLSSQSSVESEKAEKDKVTLRHLDSLPDKSDIEDVVTSDIKQTEIPKLDLAAIDTSLNVLQSVTDDLQEKEKHSSKLTRKFSSELSNINIKSPTQVAEFIKSVESDTEVKDKVKEEVKDKVKEAETPSTVDIFGVTTSESSSDTNVMARTDSQSSDWSQNKGTIDITSRTEIMKKISTKDRTPERQSPKRSLPMKVMSPFRSSASTPGKVIHFTQWNLVLISHVFRLFCYSEWSDLKW